MDKAQINGRVIEAINDVLKLHPELTKAALGELFGIKPAKFSEILNFRMNAGVEVMSELCLSFNISADWLLTGRGSMLTIKEETTPYLESNNDTVMHLVETIRKQAEEIGQLREQLARSGFNVSNAHNSDIANVG